MEIPGGWGGVYKWPSGKEIPRGWGVETKETSVGGGMDIFWNHTLYGSIRKEKWGQMCPDNAENTLDYAEISTIKAFPMYQTIQ